MVIRNYSLRTVESYLWHVKGFQVHIQKPLDQATEDDIRLYLYHVKAVKKYSRSNLHQALSAIKYLYRNIGNAAQAKHVEGTEVRSAVTAGVSHG